LLVGVVEDVGRASAGGLTTFDELREILSRKKAERLNRRKGSEAL
jgi:hypothetical protein